MVERFVSTPKDVQKNGDTNNVRLVESVLEEVKLNSFGVASLGTVKYVERLGKQNVSSTFSGYNLFNHLQIEDVEEENAMNESEDEIGDGITEGCASRPVKISKKEDKERVKKREAKVVCKLVHIQVNKRVEQNENLVLERCPGCHHDHFRFPKFCRWWKTRKTTRKAAK